MTAVELLLCLICGCLAFSVWTMAFRQGKLVEKLNQVADDVGRIWCILGEMADDEEDLDEYHAEELN